MNITECNLSKERGPNILTSNCTLSLRASNMTTQICITHITQATLKMCTEVFEIHLGRVQSNLPFTAPGEPFKFYITERCVDLLNRPCSVTILPIIIEGQEQDFENPKKCYVCPFGGGFGLCKSRAWNIGLKNNCILQHSSSSKILFLIERYQVGYTPSTIYCLT